jgi:hypothetical protein
MSGTVEIRPNGSNVWRPLVPSDVIRSGDMVMTGSDGQLLIGISNVGQIRIGEDSNFTVSETNSTVSNSVSSGIASGTQVGLGQVGSDPGHGRHHRFWLFVGKEWAKLQTLVGTSDTYEEDTPDATIGVRGTEFTVEAYENGTTAVMTLEGLVGVQDRASNSTVSLQANQTITVPNVSGGLSEQDMLERVVTVNLNSIDRWWEIPITTLSTTLATTSSSASELPSSTSISSQPSVTSTVVSSSTATPGSTDYTMYAVAGVVIAAIIMVAVALTLRRRR